MTQPTTHLQVSGHRFLVRRMEHALVRGDTRMLDDPLRAQSLSLTAGAVLALVAVAVCAVLALVRPGGAVGDAPVVVVRESGAMYVRIDDTLHPVSNLASARLIAGAPAEPRLVAQRAVDRADRGPQVGISGAPGQISPPLGDGESAWTVCDDERSETTVIAGSAQDLPAVPTANVLVTPRGGSPAVTYLLYGGWRARVDLRHPAVVRALKLDNVVPQPVSAAVLAALPEAPMIAPPRIPGLGEPGPAGHRVGTVVKVPQAGGAAADYYVLLSQGVQRIGEVAADLIRYTDTRVGEQIPTVPANLVGALPVLTTLPVTAFPERGGVTSEPVICAQWHDNRETGSHSTILTGRSVPGSSRPVALAQADGDGPAVDAVAVPAGRSVFVRSVTVTGDGHTSGALFLVTDSGVRYGIRNSDAASSLGLSGPPVPAPWPVLDTLPRGPELSREGASVVWDGIGAPAQPGHDG